MNNEGALLLSIAVDFSQGIDEFRKHALRKDVIRKKYFVTAQLGILS